MVRGLTLIYGFKRVVRSWKLFVALLLGVVLASTFFAGINIGADTAAKQVLDQQLSEVPADVVLAGWGMVWSSDNATEVTNLVFNVDGVAETEVISRTDEWLSMQLLDINETMHFEVVGVSEDSHIHDGLTVTEGASSLGTNEIYVWAGSTNASDLNIGNVLSANFSVWLGGDLRPEEPQVNRLTLNLTVAGFVELDDEAAQIALGNYYYSSREYVIVSDHVFIHGHNLLIADWNKTFSKLLDTIYGMSPPHSPIETDILAYLDRKTAINPWDPDGSITRVKTIVSHIQNEVSAHGFYGLEVTNHLEYVLSDFRNVSISMQIGFLINGIPVFFMAWYMGTTVSDVSLNLRRREIGLLLTKGFSRGQLLRMFLGEAALIGLIGGVIGIGLSLLLNPVFVMATGGELSGAPAIGTDTILLAVIFGVGVAFLSVFQPAKKASQLAAVDALREYRYVEEVKPYKKKGPWVALIFGAYKLVVLVLGINPLTLTMGRPPPSNVFIMILLVIWIAIDYGLNFVGPLLFFWGFTKIFIGESLKFQELVTKTAKFLGDLGRLATRNVQRNPFRAASIAFLIALIIWYSFLAVGAFASAQDHMTREIYFNVGADMSVSLTSTANVSKTLNEVESISDVLSTTVEYSFWGATSWGGTNIKAVNPETWLNTAYYEDEWFMDNTARNAFQSMALDNNTIILDRGLTPTLNVGDSVAVSLFRNGLAEPYTLRVVGFFGTEQPQQPLPMGQGYSVRYWSYVPEGLYKQVSKNVSAYPKILVKLKAGTNSETVADQIRQLDSIYSVSSVSEKLKEQQTDVTLSVQRLGVAFAIILASVGTALVTLVSLKERSREVSLMSVRGLSFKQLATVLLTDNLVLVLLAVLLGAVGGFMNVIGTAATNNSMAITSGTPTSIVAYRVIFPIDSLLILSTCFVLVFTSVIIPIIVMARRYVSKLERIVREA